MLGYQLLECPAREDCELAPTSPSPEGSTDAESAAWQLLCDLATREGDGWHAAARRLADAGETALLELYEPLCRPLANGSRIIGHLGQSIDGYIATASGDSSFVNDQENIRHLHRLRALNDAVIVGAGTVAADDPRLTTRRVSGPSPVRVVLDPGRRLAEHFRVFCDSEARTILVVADSTGGPKQHGEAEVMFAPAHGGAFDLNAIVAQLAELGLRKIFVEGGGTTVTRFFEAGLLDRLHIAVAPVFIGRGRPGIRLDARDDIADCPRPRHRVFTMGQDILFDCELREDDSVADATADSAAAVIVEPDPTGSAGAPTAIRRIS